MWFIFTATTFALSKSSIIHDETRFMILKFQFWCSHRCVIFFLGSLQWPLKVSFLILCFILWEFGNWFLHSCLRCYCLPLSGQCCFALLLPVRKSWTTHVLTVSASEVHPSTIMVMTEIILVYKDFLLLSCYSLEGSHLWFGSSNHHMVRTTTTSMLSTASAPVLHFCSTLSKQLLINHVRVCLVKDCI